MKVEPQVEVDPMQKEILNFSFPVDLTNAILQELGERPHIRVANIIGFIRQQGLPQFEAILKKYEENKKDEQQ